MDAGPTQTLLARSWPSLGVRRLQAIDVMRGAAMLLVILSHTAALVDRRGASQLAYLAVIRFANIASVAFMFLSGAMLSYFLETRDRLVVELRFARRAVFLLLVVHPAIWTVSWFWSPGQPAVMVQAWYITDTIAACLVLGPVLLRRLGPGARVLVASLLPVIAALLRAFWTPVSAWAATAKYLLVGSLPLTVSYPLLPWLGVFLGGSVLGTAIAKFGSDRAGFERLSDELLRFALQWLAAGAVTVGCYKIARMMQPDLGSPALLLAIQPDRVTILFPAYIGAVLLLVALIARRGSRQGFGWLAWALSVLGRTSLFAFVVHFGIVWSLPALLGLRNSLSMLTLWPAFFAFAVTVWGLCYVYGRLMNRVGKSERDWGRAEDPRELAGR